VYDYIFEDFERDLASIREFREKQNRPPGMIVDSTATCLVRVRPDPPPDPTLAFVDPAKGHR